MENLEKDHKEFETVSRHQAGKGLIKYGKPLDPLEPGRNWDDMEAEEIVDAWRYNRAKKRRTEFAVNKIKRLLDYNPTDSTNVEIFHWLDVIIGEDKLEGEES